MDKMSQFGDMVTQSGRHQAACHVGLHGCTTSQPLILAVQPAPTASDLGVWAGAAYLALGLVVRCPFCCCCCCGDSLGGAAAEPAHLGLLQLL